MRKKKNSKIKLNHTKSQLSIYHKKALVCVIIGDEYCGSNKVIKGGYMKTVSYMLKRISFFAIVYLLFLSTAEAYDKGKRYIVAVSDSHGTIQLVDIEFGKTLDSFDAEGKAFSISFGKTGNELFASTESGKVVQFDLLNRRPNGRPTRSIDLKIGSFSLLLGARSSISMGGDILR